MQRSVGLAMVALAGLLLSACGSSSTGASDSENSGRDSVQDEQMEDTSSADGGGDAQDPVWDRLRKFCRDGERFTSIKVADLRDVEREATNLLRAAASVEGAEGFIDPLKNVVRYISWVNDSQLQMLTDDSLDAVLDGEDISEAMDDLIELQRQTNEMADVGINERTTEKVRGESPPMTAVSIETDFTVECSLLP